MPFLANPVIRFVVGAILVALSLAIHVALGVKNPLGFVAIYLIFVGYAWAGAAFAKNLLGQSALWAIPIIFIPPAILFGVFKQVPSLAEDTLIENLIIGIPMAIYSVWMVGKLMSLKSSTSA